EGVRMAGESAISPATDSHQAIIPPAYLNAPATSSGSSSCQINRSLTIATDDLPLMYRACRLISFELHPGLTPGTPYLCTETLSHAACCSACWPCFLLSLIRSRPNVSSTAHSDPKAGISGSPATWAPRWSA